jgi:hypothetical protein
MAESPAADVKDRPSILCVGQGSEPRPFFAEYAYFLWGQVNYDSEGNCQRPTDRTWTFLEIMLRPAGPSVTIAPVEVAEGLFLLGVTGTLREEVWLAAYLTALRSGALVLDGRDGTRVPLETLHEWVGDVGSRLAAADRVRAMFLDPRLAPFDSHNWWGGWKWVGQFATDLTSGLRVIMNAVQTGQADTDVLEWLRTERPQPFHREGWQYAMKVLGVKRPWWRF